MKRLELRRRLARRPGAVRFEELSHYLDLCGWALDRVRGSHHVFRKDGQMLVVPMRRPHLLAVYVKDVLRRTREAGNDD